MQNPFRVQSESESRFAACPETMSLLVSLLVLVSRGLARAELDLVELHSVRVGHPFFEPLTVGRLIVACEVNGRGVFIDHAARERCLSSGLFYSDDIREMALLRIPGVVFNDRPPATIVCEVLERLGSLSLADLVPPQPSVTPAVQSAAQQAIQALHAGRSAVLMSPSECDIEAVLSHLSAAASLVVQKRSLIHLLLSADHAPPEVDHSWFSPVTVLEDADLILGSPAQPSVFTQRRLARLLAREPHILTGHTAEDAAPSVVDPWLARRLEWIRVPAAGTPQATE